MWTQEQLDRMTLSERVELAEEGKIPWGEVNRPEADRRRAAAEQRAIPIGDFLLGQTNICPSTRKQDMRRRNRRNANREHRAYVEALLSQSIRECREANPHLAPAALNLRSYLEAV